MEKEETIIYFVTENIHKFNEISDLFSKTKTNYNLKRKEVETVEIQATNLKEVASFKLNSVKGQISGSYFIEDAGFFVDTPLNGFPGVYSSYVMKTIGNKGILKLIDNFDETQAHFTSVIALYFKPLDVSLFFEGKIYGKVSKTLRGSGGFGFDPIFLPDIIPNKTFAELTTEEKNKISHRGKAWSNFIKFIKENKY
ncbi:MAG: RdgB/HAM1 family non-canonical purine NTP pyrophosphatase [Candidatus Lokiarchaeota archaeon]|nr:RdgB/HAM1 family non-canonical purine NTP pyrophosphatase [Candidatus Lokiarchaeota archaeon]